MNKKVPVLFASRHDCTMRVEGSPYIDLEAPDDNYRLPEPGIDPFEGAGPPRTYADIEFVPRPVVVGSYKLAADILVKYLEDCNSGSQQNWLVFPIAYLYRHFIEIALKDILTTIGYKENVANLGHDLNRIWEQCKAELNSDGLLNGLVQNGEHLNGFEEILSRINEVDPASIRFRYDVDRRGYAHPIDRIDRIQLSHFAETLDTIEHFFETIRIGYEMQMEHVDDY